MKRSIRVLIVDDSTLVRQALKEVLSESPDEFSLMGSVGDRARRTAARGCADPRALAAVSTTHPKTV